MRVAYDGTSGLHLLHRERPDLLLPDLMLPDKDGWALTQPIHSSGRWLPLLSFKANKPRL